MISYVQLHHGDSRDVLRNMIERGETVHSVVTDPPYHLESIVKRFGKPSSAPAKHGTDGAFARQSAGFMSKQWDGADENGVRIAQDPEFWNLVWQVLKPGGFVIAFSSSRTYGWMQVAMEQAGFVTHPMIGWIQGQGFPKAHNAGQAVEKQITTGVARRPDRDLGGLPRDRWSGSEEGTLFANTGGRIPLTTEEAKAWEGWAYGLQTLKPSLEPIYVGQKPFDQKNGALNLLTHGVGAMNIDGCRVPTDEVITNHSRGAESAVSKGVFGDSSAQETHQTPGQAIGRHPANVLHDGSDAVVECFPDSAGQIARSSSSSESRRNQSCYGDMKRGAGEGQEPRNDPGSAARFFNALPFTQDDEPPFIYHPKATKADRIIGCTVCGSRALREPGCDCRDPENPDKPAKRMSHPTVKPIKLIRWLQRLVTPLGGTTLDPFAGSGTSGAAALAEGFNSILIEREDDYAADIRARLGLTIPDADASDDADLFDRPLPRLGSATAAISGARYGADTATLSEGLRPEVAAFQQGNDPTASAGVNSCTTSFDVSDLF